MMADRKAVDSAERIVAVARSWLGTPYRHQACAKGAGADCLGLIRGVWREVVGREPEAPPPYTSDWMEASGDERLWRAADRLLAPGIGDQPGEVLLFRMDARSPAKHLAILGVGSPDATIIHAYSGRSVIESPFGESWRRRVVAAFRFPIEA